MSRSNEHAGQRLARLYCIVGVFGVVAGLVALLGASYGPSFIFAGIFFITSVFTISQARVLGRYGAAEKLTAETGDRIANGKLDEAEAALKTLRGRAWATRTIGLLDATIAIARGDLDLALRAIEPATRATQGLLLRSWEEERRVEALSIRALVRAARAAKGESEEALEDVKSVETHPQVRPPALARAALARALTLKEEALTAHLQSNAGLILEHGGARERLLFRALRGLIIHERSSVYREAARAADEPMNEGVAADANGLWVLRVAPQAARYAPRVNRVDADEEEDDEPSFTMHREALRKIADSRRVAVSEARSKRKIWRPIALAATGFVGFVGFIYATSFIGTPLPEDPNAPLPPPTLMQYLTPLLCGLVAILLLSAVIRWGRRLANKSALADRAVLSSKDDEASTLLHEIAAIPNAFVAERVFAHTRLAMLATRRGDFEEALKECDRGTGLAALGSLFKVSDVEYFPTLLSERAFVLAALGRVEEAETEMATVASSYPNFSAMSRASFRVRLMMAVKAGDFAKAARLAQRRSLELPIDLRTELLADAVLVKANLVTRTEAARIRGELETAPHHLQAWVRSLLGDLSALSAPNNSARDSTRAARVVEEQEAVEEGLEERASILDGNLRRLHL